jgi:ribonucleotide monophosphatase NagD (HAD superfamily)
MTKAQTRGREANGAAPGGKPDPLTSDEAVARTGRQSRKAAGPDGPDATVIGDGFKTAPGTKP